jgi:hypothetical protein
MKRLLLSLTLFALSAFAADPTGTWKATADGPNGSMDRTFTFKVDGTKLTGETNSELVGKSTLEDGKVDGDTISFNIKFELQGNEMKTSFKGKTTGDEITLSEVVGDTGMTLEWKGKRNK